MDEKALKKILLKENEDFKKAYELHKEYEEELENFKAKGFLTEEEKLQEKEIKKKKLILKDKMYFMMRKYKRSPQS